MCTYCCKQPKINLESRRKFLRVGRPDTKLHWGLGTRLLNLAIGITSLITELSIVKYYTQQKLPTKIAQSLPTVVALCGCPLVL